MASERGSRDRSQRRRRARAGIVAAGALVVPTALLVGGAGAQNAPGSDPAQVGSFGETFVEPTISDFTGHPRVTTDERCIERPAGDGTQTGGPTGQGFIDCKPAAGGLVQLTNGKNLYYDNLAGTENVELSIASEYGVVGLNDQSRVLDPNAKTWEEPTPVDAGAKSQADIDPIVPGELFRTTEEENDGSLFCADVNFLADGRVIAIGGTKYTNDPGNDASKFGSTELLGIENARIFDPDTNKWTQTGSLNKPRWYPTATTLGDGRMFVASGLRRLVKAVNTQDAGDPNATSPGFGLQEGQNERVTETFDPRTARFTENGDSARRSLPLFPRMHLLPNGNVFYNAAGQAFNPLGQAFDQALWNIAATYSPKTQSWTDLGIPGVGVSAVPGYRGSTFSVMMPLQPGENGDYSRASFLTGGGVTGAIAVGSPGGYTAVRDSYISNIETDGDKNTMTPEDAGDMTATSTPANGRWYGTGTLLPTGEVLATSGADRDEVAVPGFEIPVKHAELYDPETKTWRRLASQSQARTYHNTAALMPDGRVLIGGHATISNAYARNRTLPGGVTAPNDGRDPTFEIFSPPYLSCPGAQTEITSIRPQGDELEIDTSVPASEIESVVAIRNASITHVVDADQRNVEMKVLSREGNTLRLAQAPSGNVLPDGPYMLFVNRNVGGCVKPGKSAQLFASGNGKLAPQANDGNCLSRRARIGRRNVGRVVLNRSRRVTLRRPVAEPESRTRRTFTWCVDGNAGKVKAVFNKTGPRSRMMLTGTTAGVHRHRGLRPAADASSSRLRAAFPRRLTVVHGRKGNLRIFRATSTRSRRVIGIRGDRVAFLGVAQRSMLRKGNRDRLRRSVRLAGF
jgi:hypothetical protein